MHNPQNFEMETSLPYFGVKLSCVCLMFAYRKNSLYRVSSKTVPTLLFALLMASTCANCKSWDIFLKFRKFAT